MRTLCIATAAAALTKLVSASAGTQDIPGALVPTQTDPPTRQGTRGANFLELGVGARAAAMAGAATAFTEGPSALYWNPSGLATLQEFAIGGSRQNLYDDLDIAHNYAGLGLPFAGGVIGAHFIGLNSGDLERTTEESPLGGDPTLGSTFEWVSTAIGVSYARQLTDRLNLGGTVKYVSEGINGASLNWVALDLGTQFQTGIYGLTFGAALSNIGGAAQARGALVRRKINSDEVSPERTAIEFQTQETELPTMFRFSLGSDIYGGSDALWGQTSSQHRVIGELAMSDAIDTDVQAAFGFEYGWRDLVFLRAGKRFYNDDRDAGEDSSLMYGLSGGLGMRLPLGDRGLRFDYAYTSLGEQLQNVQVFSLEFGR